MRRFQLQILCVMMMLVVSCTKSSENTIPEPSIPTGIYTGSLGAASGTTNNSFKIEVSKVAERQYLIKQVTNWSLPPFTLSVNKAITPSDIQLEQGGYLKCTIPNQTTVTGTVKGDGASTGDEDGSYYSSQKRLTFVIQINNSGVRVAYSGTKD
jgi:hypothetical protein